MPPLTAIALNPGADAWVTPLWDDLWTLVRPLISPAEQVRPGLAPNFGSSLTRTHRQQDAVASSWSTLVPLAIGIGARSCPSIAVKLAYGTALGALGGLGLGLYKREHGEALLREVVKGAFAGAMSIGVLERGLETLLGEASAYAFRASVSGAVGGFIAGTVLAGLEGQGLAAAVESGLVSGVMGAGISSGLVGLIHGRSAFCGDFSLRPLKEEFVLFAKSLGTRDTQKTLSLLHRGGSIAHPMPPGGSSPTPPDPFEVNAVHHPRTPHGVYILEGPAITRGLMVGLGARRPQTMTWQGPFGETAFTVSKTGEGLTPTQVTGVGDAILVAEFDGPTSKVKRQLLALADGMGGHGKKGYHDAIAAESVLLAVVRTAVKRASQPLHYVLEPPPATTAVEHSLVDRIKALAHLGKAPKEGGMGTTLVYHLNEIQEEQIAGQTRQVLRTLSGTTGDSRNLTFLYDKTGTLHLLRDLPRHEDPTQGYLTNSFIARDKNILGLLSYPIDQRFGPGGAYIEQSPIARFLLPETGQPGTAKLVQLRASDGLARALPDDEIFSILEGGLSRGEGIATIQTALAVQAQIVPHAYKKIARLSLYSARTTVADINKALEPFIQAQWLSTTLQDLKRQMGLLTSTPGLAPSAMLWSILRYFDQAKLGAWDDLSILASATDVEKML